MRRHHVEKHQTFHTNFPEGSQERAAKVQSLIASYNRSSTTMVRSFTAQERATAASLRVSWILAKKKRPFTDSETVKDCMLAVVDEVINDDKIKTSVASAIKNVPLSDTSNIRRVEILAAAVICFREELLCLLPLEGHTTGDIVFGKISAFFKDNGLDMTRVCMLVTDGAPSMTGKVNGLAARWSAVAPQLISLHCIVHQAVLCAKLSGALKTTMDNVMATINFIRSTSSLQHRLFRMLLSEMSAEHHDLLLHNDVRWLSKGKALVRFCGLREEIITFLRSSKHKKAETHLSRILDDNFMADASFLSDIFKHLNDLNLALQGRDKTVIDLVEQMRAFPVKLDLFATDLSTGRMLHFPTLRKFISSPAQITDVMTDFIARLKMNCAGRLDGLVLPSEVALFVRDPFTVALEGDLSARAKQVVPSIDEGKFTLELVDMQSSVTMAQELCTNGPTMFWTDVNVHQFPNIKKVAIVMLSMFGSTYTCESSFSHMNSIKSNYRCSLTDCTLHQCLRIALTTYEPKVTALVQNKKCHFSH
ncbi:SCAN domain-containing protein 3-like [Onychostoma macrolepis]|uniref:SCAN domain-containing protein 3-like n=1 Tax=Onychostoma macrolepis TaxID=369639 RepID=UPI0027297876|nr:SCAN domain-containing protein 3-like [Onychostoma macrolepis]